MTYIWPFDRRKDQNLEVDLNNDSLEFARFMQSKIARKFTKREGFPIKLSQVFVYDLYDDNLPWEKRENLQEFSRDRMIAETKHVYNPYINPLRRLSYDQRIAYNFYDIDKRDFFETSIGKVVGESDIKEIYGHEFGEELDRYFHNLFDKSFLYLHESLVVSDHFNEIKLRFPLFDSVGNCVYLTDLSEGSIFIPGEFERKSLNALFTPQLHIRDDSLENSINS